MKKFLLLLVILGGVISAVPDMSYAEVKLPSYAGGGAADAKAQSIGKKVTDFVALAVGILAILGMLAGAGFFAVGNKDRGWQLLSGGIVALIIAGLVYGIAALVT
ncbi:MAG: hypothetical protein FD165_2625 [Gammaproteobacteria bacterium]|nr:MAG: hypothetical protein FD165_2625 [Gammaproteobacteria bacterium]TND01598.1 MAG: hypothetical protein FD120_2546 [Gammaproteobacteria bacterium]